jgi:predicted aspartyl protease
MALAAGMLGVAALSATPDQGEIIVPQQADVLSFKNDANDRMTVPVSITGTGPYRFLVDTGAERTVIARELADRLDLGAGGEIRVHSMTEASDIGTAIIPHLQISKSSMTDVRAPALPAANIGAAGMLGVDSLKSQRVLIDFDKQTMSVTPSAKKQAYWGPDTIVVIGRSLYGRLILMDARLDGEKIIVVVDTGSELTIGNNALRQRLVAKKKMRPTVPIELESVTGGKMTADYTTVRDIRLGDAIISNFPVGFAEVHPFERLRLTDRPAILLGMDALRLFKRVSVDFERKQVRLLGPDTGGGAVRQQYTATPTRIRPGA